MKPVSSQFRAIFIIVSVLLISAFYESKRIEVFSVGIDSAFLRNLAIGFSSASESIKSTLGIKPFFAAEERFWTKLKESPLIFSVSTPVPVTAPQIHPTPTPEKPLKIEAPYNVLIVGDSFIAERFGYQLEKELLLYRDVTVQRKGIYSTGLSRPDYFNWEKELNILLETQKPNITVVMFGANDGQDQTTLDGKVIHYGTVEWNNEYSKRVSAFLYNLERKNIFTFWIGNPMPRDDYYSKKMQNLNSIYEKECLKEKNTMYISTWSFLADSNGNFSNYLPDEFGDKKLARTSDGIHVTVFGADIMVKKVMDQIKERVELKPLQQDGKTN